MFHIALAQSLVGDVYLSDIRRLRPPVSIPAEALAFIGRTRLLGKRTKQARQGKSRNSNPRSRLRRSNFPLSPSPPVGSTSSHPTPSTQLPSTSSSPLLTLSRRSSKNGDPSYVSDSLQVDPTIQTATITNQSMEGNDGMDSETVANDKVNNERADATKDMFSETQGSDDKERELEKGRKSREGNRRTTRRKRQGKRRRNRGKDDDRVTKEDQDIVDEIGTGEEAIPDKDDHGSDDHDEDDGAVVNNQAMSSSGKNGSLNTTAMNKGRKPSNQGKVGGKNSTGRGDEQGTEQRQRQGKRQGKRQGGKRRRRKRARSALKGTGGQVKLLEDAAIATEGSANYGLQLLSRFLRHPKVKRQVFANGQARVRHEWNSGIFSAVSRIHRDITATSLVPIITSVNHSYALSPTNTSTLLPFSSSLHFSANQVNITTTLTIRAIPRATIALPALLRHAPVVLVGGQVWYLSPMSFLPLYHRLFHHPIPLLSLIPSP